MEFPSSRKEWIEWIALTLAAVAFSQMNILFFFFLVPLQIVFHRRDFFSYGLSGAVVLLLIVLFSLLRVRMVESALLKQGLLLMELAFPFLLLAGGAWVNYSVHLGYRNLYRLLFAAAGAAVISVPAILVLTKNRELMNLLQEQFTAVAKVFLSNFQQADNFESSVLSGVLAPERMLEYTTKVFFKSYVFFYFFILAGCAQVSDLIMMRIRGVYYRRLDTFRVPDFFIWPLLVGWAGVLLDTWKGIGVAGYVFWNGALVFLFLYGLQGIGVLRALLHRYRVPMFVRLFIGLICVMILMRPGLNLIVFIGIPGLGVSELWIRYRRNQ
ncbi:MAG: DUF2232 domain-containing protein [Spirochaetales bacterium]|nr:DUF2232 domain-containing protein [Spirochaetales bacterium]